MHWGLIRSIIILPGTVLVFVPAVLLFITRDSKVSFEFFFPDKILFWLAFFIACPGFFLCFKTASLFMTVGKGTPAPWNPPKKLVLQGPYQYVRNPMITGAVLLLFSEALLFRSWPVALWMILFFACKTAYFLFIEEKELEKRFHKDYLIYKANVPRWIPRLRPWKQVD